MGIVGEVVEERAGEVRVGSTGQALENMYEVK